MTDPSAPYKASQTAAQQTMQQPQSGPPSTTGGAGAGAGGALPQSPGAGGDQAGSKSLSSLVTKLKEALQGLGLSQSGSNQVQDAMAELEKAAGQADETLKQTGSPQYPAPPPPPPSGSAGSNLSSSSSGSSEVQ